MGLRVIDLLEPDTLRTRIEANVDWVRHWVSRDGGGRPDLDPAALIERYTAYGEALRPLLADVSLLLHRALKEGRSVLLEGAQGSLLDVDHGTYPFVTSSSATSGGALIGSGVGPGWVHDIIGVAKAYTTRVGRGPFPTEMPAEQGNRLRDQGAEFGATTGRPRRCGWLDGVGLRHAVRVSGLKRLALTKIDIMSGMPTLKIATGYEIPASSGRGTEFVTEFPASQRALAEARPVYEEHVGWVEDISGCRTWDSLPGAAQRYIRRISEIADTPISWVSVGSARDQTITIA